MLAPRSLATLFLLLLLAACGQKGPLVLEDEGAGSTPAVADQAGTDQASEEEEDEDEEAPDP